MRPDDNPKKHKLDTGCSGLDGQPTQQRPRTNSSSVLSPTSSGTIDSTAGSQSAPVKPDGASPMTDEKPISGFYCNYCSRDLSTVIRVRCAICHDYDSCLDCYSVGAELYPHKSDHPYRLVLPMSSPVYELGWSADEEGRLLDYIEIHSVDNWEIIAKGFVGKSAAEVKRHWYSAYMRTQPIPRPAGMFYEELESSEVPENFGSEVLKNCSAVTKVGSAFWMEKRGDIGREWDDEAKEMMADLEIHEFDTEEDKVLKLLVIKSYDCKIDERQRRKMFVQKRGLFDMKAHSEKPKMLSPEEKALRDELCVYSRFISESELNNLVAYTLEERRASGRVGTLQPGISVGAKSVNECFEMASNHLGGGDVPPQKPCEAKAGSSSNIPISQTEQTGQSRLAGNNAQHSYSHGAAGTNSTGNIGTGSGKEIEETCHDVEQIPGADLLSRAEVKLCKSLKISFHQYVAIKESMTVESARKGLIWKKDTKEMFILEVWKVLVVFDYFVGCGWTRHRRPANKSSNGNC